MQAARVIAFRPCRACVLQPARRAPAHTRLVRAAAGPPQQDGPSQEPDKEPSDGEQRRLEQEQERKDAEGRRQRLDELKSSLKKMGIDKSTAQRILSIWKTSGAESPEGLRKLFLKRSFNRSQQIGLQLLVDAASGAGAFYAARTISTQELGTWALAVKSGMYFISMYLFIGASFEFFSLMALFYAAYKYSTNADAFLLAVQDLAGASSGLSVVDQAKQAVNIVKVLQALDQIRELLKAGDEAQADTFFASLGVYLTLERAQRLYGFEAGKYGLDDAAAADIAAVFARYDSNDDGFISLDEFRRLCNENQVELSGAEVQAAFDLLDIDKSGALDFGEWVQWFLQKKREFGWKEGSPLSSMDQQAQQAQQAQQQDG